jgi:1-acyl-sn-glycerol-3-phosphate acyltransferase
VDFRIVHKRSIYLIPIVGWFLYLAGHIGVDRRKAFRARRSLASAARRIRSGASVAVFPEGTRSRDGSVRRFKRGSFVLAQDAGVPVVPVSLAGVKALMPRGLPTLRPGSIELRIHPPIASTGTSAESAERLADEVRAVVAAGCEAGEGVG